MFQIHIKPWDQFVYTPDLVRRLLENYEALRDAGHQSVDEAAALRADLDRAIEAVCRINGEFRAVLEEMRRGDFFEWVAGQRVQWYRAASAIDAMAAWLNR